MTTVTYTSGSGTVSLPANVDVVSISIWGGGASGTMIGGQGSAGTGGGGGGARGLASFSARGISSYTYSVGPGGVSTGNNSQNPGQNTTFVCGSYSLTAGGGTCGSGISGGAGGVGSYSGTFTSVSFGNGVAGANGYSSGGYPVGGNGGSQTYGSGGSGWGYGTTAAYASGSAGAIIVSYTTRTMKYHTPPFSLVTIGTDGGLSSPYSMIGLRGKTLYNSAGGPPTTVGNTLYLSNTFMNQSF